MKFQNKILLAFLLLILLPIFILGLVSYHVTSTTLKDKVGEETVYTLESIGLNLQMVLSEVNTLSNYIISSREVQDFIKYNDEKSLLDFYNQGQAIAGLLYGQSKLNELVLYSEVGQVYSFQRTEIPSFQQFQKSEFFQLLKAEEGRPVWITTVDSHKFMENDKPIFSQGRLIKDLNTLNAIGYLILDVRLDRFDEVFQALQQDDSQTMIVNDRGEVVYHLSHEMIGETIALPQEMIVSQSGTFINHWEKEKSLISYIPITFNENEISSFYLVSVKPWSFITSETKFIRNITILLVIVVTVFAIFFKQLFLNNIIHFITEFQANMKQVEKGQLSTRMQTFAYRELNQLAKSFNRMVDEISILLNRVKDEQERKRKAEFKVLQNQINPHFLYNTLESINSMAVLHGSREISKMTINLGKLLRISINSDDRVRVSDEVRHAISYLEIQKIRFNERFTFEITCDKELEHHYILKLVLQPLVENTLKHGFDKNKLDGFINIRGGISNTNQGFLFIEDNGCGISKDVLAAFNESNKLRKTLNQSIGCGVMNVQERMKLYYGDRYGIMICSYENAGTIIKLTFPLSEGEHHDL
ncbi:sensor histidine kinase [Alkalihalobacillus sp. MEB130]|uniref:cache domain-containing sensor histidine kinase n=1 Tax=Alkalihalobacillus sp. MEB130 TaxID=2976704 RepID=UPI0028DD591D|nr:sensor histidine kinase [Alkalihalobacillus sp. MEB130]MDT8860762.1 sensor histidine kinase [Alkalihalobacillus sp. MEB130]